MITPTLEELRERIGCVVIYLDPGKAPREVGTPAKVIPTRARLVKILDPATTGRVPKAVVEIDDRHGFPYETAVPVHAIRLAGGY